MTEPFPPTRPSLVEALSASSADARARGADAVARAYWRPVYSYLRLRWRLEREDAEDLTQEFFSRAFAHEWLTDYDPARARFRTFLRVAIDRLAANARRDHARLKRGGGTDLISLDFSGAESGLEGRVADPAADPDAVFRAEWIRAFFADCVDALRTRLVSRGRGVMFDVFSRYELADVEPRPTYAEVGAVLGIPATQVTNHLHAARREFRGIVVARLRDECGDGEDFRTEARALLGIDPD